MALREYPSRVLLASSLSSLLILGITVTVAIFLFWEQTQITDNAGENVESQRAAIGMRDVLTALTAFHERGIQDVDSLHKRAETHLADIERFADKEHEQELVRRITISYRQYLNLWAQADKRSDVSSKLVRHLQQDSLPACQELQEFNMGQVDQSQREHRESLHQLIWGLAVIGGLGSVAGLVLGYGLSRGLRRTIQQFLVRVQGAADLLGPEVTTVEWQRAEKPFQNGDDDLLLRIEHAVVRLQRREREVHRVERMAALGQLAAGLAHEIRNPLTSILLLFQTARNDPSAGGLTDEDIDLIEQELHRIERCLQDFLDFARPPKLSRSTCDLAQVVHDALALTKGRIDQQGTAIHLDTPAEICLLDADREQLRQVVVNLILNALDAMPLGGQLGLFVHSSADGDHIELNVTDTGPGISSQILPRLFEPFATGKDTGLGLGLVISKRIVEEHGGTIRGSNRSEGGASFVVRLPLRQSELQNSKPNTHGDDTVDRR